MPAGPTTLDAPAAAASNPGSARGHAPFGRRDHLALAVATVLTLGLVVASAFVGVYDIAGAPDGAEMFGITRLPRTVALVLSGAALAVCGLVMQLITQNRFVEPSTTGTTEWAGLGLLGTMIVFPEAPLLVRMIGAVIAAFLGTLVFFAFLQKVTLRSSVVVPIVGIMLGSVVGALSTYLALATNMLQSLGIWFAGSYTSVIKGQYEPMWAVLVVFIVVTLAADRFTAAGLGEEFSTNLGLHYRAVVLLGTGCVALASGIITVVIGNLPFLGLVVPNLVSLLRGDDLRSNLPWVALAGIALVTVADLIGRTIIAPFEVPASLILAMVGAVCFIALILRGRRHA